VCTRIKPILVDFFGEAFLLVLLLVLLLVVVVPSESKVNPLNFYKVPGCDNKTKINQNKMKINENKMKIK